MGLYIEGWKENRSQPCVRCGKDFKTTNDAQRWNRVVYLEGPEGQKGNPYGQYCEPCCRLIMEVVRG